MEQPAHARHVGHRVQGAHLVEVDLVHAVAVDGALRLGDEAVHRLGVGAHRLREGQIVNQTADL